MPKFNLVDAKVDEIKSPSVYEVRLAYVPSAGTEYGITKFSRDGSMAELIDGSTFSFDGIDLLVKDKNGRKRNVAIIAELLEPDKSLDDHEKGTSYRIIGTNPEALANKVNNGVYAILFALENGNSKKGYVPLSNLAEVLKPVQRVKDINKLADMHGIFEVAYSVSGGYWGAQKREALESVLLNAGMDKNKVNEALKVYDKFIDVSSYFEGGSVFSMIADPTKIQKKLDEIADSNTVFLILAEKITGARELDRENYKKLEKLGLEMYDVDYNEILKRMKLTQKLVEDNKKPYRDLTSIINSNLPDQEKIKEILSQASHDARLHFEYLNPFENFYLIGPEELALDRLAGMTEKDVKAMISAGKLTKVHLKVFEALQAIKTAGAVKVMKDGSEKTDPFSPKENDVAPKESDMTFIHQRRYNEKDILELFYMKSGLDPRKYPIYVAAVKNRHFDMETMGALSSKRDEYYVDHGINAKVREMEGKGLDVPSENMLKRIKLHALWKLERYERLHKDLIDKAIEFTKDRVLSPTEEAWISLYGEAIKEVFPEISYRFLKQLILDKAEKEESRSPLMKKLVAIYKDILYNGLGMDSHVLERDIPTSRERSFIEAYIESRFCADPNMTDKGRVIQLFEEAVVKDSRWLDELSARGIKRQLDELLFKYLFPNVEGLSRDIKQLIQHSSYVDTIGSVMESMIFNSKLCDEDQFVKLYLAKQKLDIVEADLFEEIMYRVVNMQKNEGKLRGGMEKYIADMFEVIRDTISQYSSESFESQDPTESGGIDEIVHQFELSVVAPHINFRRKVIKCVADVDKKIDDELQAQKQGPERTEPEKKYTADEMAEELINFRMKAIGLLQAQKQGPEERYNADEVIEALRTISPNQKLFYEIMPQNVRQVPELQAAFIYQKIKERVGKIERPNEVKTEADDEESEIKMPEGDTF